MAGGKDVYRESSDVTQEALNGIKAGEVNLYGALRDAKNLVKPDWEGMARVERGRSPGRESVDKKFPGENLGAKIADLLVGYTTEKEQQEIRRIINGITDKTVIGLLKGYYDNIGFTKGWGDGFFEQLRVEFGFEDKINLIHKVGYELAKYAENHNNKTSARVIRNICDKQTFSTSDSNELHQQHIKILKDAGVKVDFKGY